MKYLRKLVGRRLYLSPVSEDDAETYVKWMNDAEVAVNFGEFPKMVASKSDLSWIYEPPKSMHRFAIVLSEGDRMIGSISLHNIDHLNRNAFIGIFIGDAETRGKGCGAEAIRLILEYGFLTMNLHSINLTVHSDNAAGIKCYKNAGFKEVGRLREIFRLNGEYVDKIYMEILDREYREGLNN